MNIQKQLCKLTDKNNQTFNNTLWGEGVTHTASGKGELCGSSWIHYYNDPLLAVLLNPIHANFPEPNLWSIEVSGDIKSDHGLKFGATKVTTVKQIPLPVFTLEQRVAFGILCSLEVFTDPDYVQWANKWLSGEDRTAKASGAAMRAAGAAWAAEWAAKQAVKWAVKWAASSKIDLSALAREALEGK